MAGIPEARPALHSLCETWLNVMIKSTEMAEDATPGGILERTVLMLMHQADGVCRSIAPIVGCEAWSDIGEKLDEVTADAREWQGGEITDQRAVVVQLVGALNAEWPADSPSEEVS